MTSDKQRREVAENLRALDVSDLGDAGNVIDTTEDSGALFALILHVANDYRPGLHYATSHFVARDAVELFADLIDRPTCRLVEDEHGYTYCSERGFTAPCMLDASYCPDCGARVVRGDE